MYNIREWIEVLCVLFERQRLITIYYIAWLIFRVSLCLFFFYVARCLTLLSFISLSHAPRLHSIRFIRRPSRSRLVLHVPIY